MQYGQFCPVSKAAEILGERWTMLIVRELLMGGQRFSQLQRGLGDISPALLTARLKQFEEAGLVTRRRIPGQRGYEYLPTPACEALLPVLKAVGDWGMVYQRSALTEDDFDLDFLMFYLERSIDPAALPGGAAIIRFKFRGAPKEDWWLVVDKDKTDVCMTDPGRDIDVYITTTFLTMHDVWMGDRSYREAMEADELFIEGEPALTRRISTWLRPSLFHDSERTPRPELALAA